MTVKPVKSSAVQKIERSKLSKKAIQQELMGDDLDLPKVLVYLQSKIRFNSIDRIKDVKITRTIEGASTVEVSLLDFDRAVLRSGVLSNKFDIVLDGLWFRYVKGEKSGDMLTLTFEDREISILRTYNKLKVARRALVTRAEFINNLINEATPSFGTRLPRVIPDLHQVEAIGVGIDLADSSTQQQHKVGGIAEDVMTAATAAHVGVTKQNAARSALTVKGATADKTQIQNANTILHVGVSMGARRKVLVCAIMTAITESQIRNLTGGDADSVGTFQQRASWGSVSDRLNVATAARLFYEQAIKADTAVPDRPYWDLCAQVQNPREDLRQAYATWRTEGERIVTAYGIPGGDSEGAAAEANAQTTSTATAGDYIFYRGIPSNQGKTWKKEDTWTCVTRLADEVDWRAFFVSGVFYYIDDDDLFKSKPLATITESSIGVEGIDGDYDVGKKSATVTVTARVGTWLIPPGAVIVLQDMGMWDGRWIVNTFERSLFDSKATITLKKPRPALKEPVTNDTQGLKNPAAGAGGFKVQSVETDPVSTKVGGDAGLVQPVPAGHNTRIVQGVHSTVGLSGQHYPYFIGTWPSDDAADFGADAGAPVQAVENGVIIYLSGHDPANGPSDPILGVHGPFGWSLYLKGDSGSYYYYTHLGSRLVKLNDRVTIGEQIGTVGDYQFWGGVNHAHVGVFPAPSGNPDINDLIKADK